MRSPDRVDASRKLLLFDDALIDEKKGFVLTMDPAIRMKGLNS